MSFGPRASGKPRSSASSTPGVQASRCCRPRRVRTRPPPPLRLAGVRRATRQREVIVVAENKTKPTKVSAAAFIATVEDEKRRKDCRELVAVMREVTGQPPKMWGTSIVGFDRYRYRLASGKENEMLLTGFSPRKQDLVLYLGPGLQNAKLRGKLGKHKAGQGCLYLKTLEDVDRDALRSLIEYSVAEMRKRHPSS